MAAIKAILFSLLLVLRLISLTAEEETKEAKEKTAAAKKEIFLKIEEKIRPVLQGLEPAPQFEYGNKNTLKITYKTQIFKIHGRLRTGEIGEKTRNEVGPKHNGLMISFHLQKADTVHQAVTPQTTKEPYWTSFIDFIPSSHPEFKIYWGVFLRSAHRHHAYQKDKRSNGRGGEIARCLLPLSFARRAFTY